MISSLILAEKSWSLFQCEIQQPQLTYFSTYLLIENLLTGEYIFNSSGRLNQKISLHLTLVNCNVYTLNCVILTGIKLFKNRESGIVKKIWNSSILECNWFSSNNNAPIKPILFQQQIRNLLSLKHLIKYFISIIGNIH